MVEKVVKSNVIKEKGYLYFVDRNGNVSRTKMARGGGRKGRQKQEVVLKVGIKKQASYLYFIDKYGDIARAKMIRK